MNRKDPRNRDDQRSQKNKKYFSQYAFLNSEWTNSIYFSKSRNRGFVELLFEPILSRTDLTVPKP